MVLHLVLLPSVQGWKKSKTVCPPSFHCNGLGSLTFPFHNTTDPQCGLCKLNCNGPVPKIQLKDKDRWYDVVRISQPDNTVVIRDQDFQDHLNSQSCNFWSYDLPSTRSISFTVLSNITLFMCPNSPELTQRTDDHFGKQSGRYLSYKNCRDKNIYYKDPSAPPPAVDKYSREYNSYGFSSSRDREYPDYCRATKGLPVLPDMPLNGTHVPDLFSMLTAEFSVGLRVSDGCLVCRFYGGQCLDDRYEYQSCVYAGEGTLLTGVVITVVLLYCVWKRFSYHLLSLHMKMLIKRALLLPTICKPMINWLNKTRDVEDIESLQKYYRPLALKRYRYSDVKKMTNSFKDKLGQGGYGGVFKGQLHDGRPVAVKILNRPKDSEEEFANEVASIGRTNHVNIVTLLGFCSDSSKKALIYEFMPNGSLDKFIYNEKSSTERKLGWKALYEISLGIARGLEYLHRWCSTQILHFDIKPHNILLSEDFCPKIVDFGLAKLCYGKESVVSMLGMRGTVGYIAPEVFSRIFGGVSHKSDVYSYGMMLLEMVGGRKNSDENVDHASKKYFPEWIYNRLEIEEEIQFPGIMNEEEKENALKMVIVGLWCIQSDPTKRPSIRNALDMLEGSLESLQIPPRPFLVYPPESPADSSSACTIETSSFQSVSMS
ncbi:hypothetical protein RJ640_017227 [Escallonia rubra]|uniref:non-specific serine/threonine protein kinase n=1 Tax=Escallonia rubra TaxID=112253 RepID=A0AA88QCN3_9ASTE|nr:hypothetical protein RJ640_017227 [Escallonia rubra]